MKARFLYGVLCGSALLWMGAVPWLIMDPEGNYCHCTVIYVTLLGATAAALYFVARGLDLRTLGLWWVNRRRIGRWCAWLLRICYGVLAFVWGLATVVLSLKFVTILSVTTMNAQLGPTIVSQGRVAMLWLIARNGLGALVGGLNAACLLWFAVLGSTSMRRAGSTRRDESPRPV
ncbi:MAG TPA: hypothetical protein VIM11_26970 [Tepidisphaeraceae bacterium]|jgi:hypothetical protein